ncbi:peptidylprolyl isomerase [Levilactobacillus brevis]|jgi:peptidyl-prolyl cis-trans isomerase B (cyclophilin B)|uniref:Peptidyl-prolyl cis-trans isomerase n=3 Tax=Levilactobacillus brevis TaxID=1580 RepID=Q03R91_LEVBA|nr:peptidylprolyl isomerase [Levilactobacillus brevis]MDN6543540.1 peptidylprolyl isomerase [Lentilactobacillus parabuchneri]ABJ64281.1 Peptidyl-prolyl cis-trans isomerase (rotamase) - cyclophilin family [Levilactobacillus brevis ATCC 367]ANN48803.1 peptidylprolyl isomerase [Levilactobacillus brevis]ARN90361.1 peptidylprolyl isomerase [Levilactobacillus brevis]ARN97991.1 peptidylprolyl isomerase [Levilactobacillus brevis]
MTKFPQIDLANARGPQVTIETSMGTIQLQLFPEQAPKTVENFVTHAQAGYYDGLTFHRVIPNFMIQGGDPTGTGMGGESIWGQPFEDEFSQELYNLRGAVSMANAGPNTNGSQFFIVQDKDMTEQMQGQMKDAGFPDEIVDAYKNGGTPWLDFRHTVFGQVISGMDVVDAIAQVKTDASDQPATPVTMDKVTIQEND